MTDSSKPPAAVADLARAMFDAENPGVSWFFSPARAVWIGRARVALGHGAIIGETARQAQIVASEQMRDRIVLMIDREASDREASPSNNGPKVAVLRAMAREVQRMDGLPARPIRRHER